MSDRIRNWSEYNADLKQRGNLTVWISYETSNHWFHQDQTGKRGASPVYPSFITFDGENIE